MIRAMGTTLTFASYSWKVKSINGVGVERESADVTHLASTDAYKEYLPGVNDAGTVTLQVYHEAAYPVLMMTDTVSDAVITLPGTPSHRWTCSAFIKSYKTNIQDGYIMADVVLQQTGKPTVA